MFDKDFILRLYLDTVVYINVYYDTHFITTPH